MIIHRCFYEYMDYGTKTLRSTIVPSISHVKQGFWIDANQNYVQRGNTRFEWISPSCVHKVRKEESYE